MHFHLRDVDPIPYSGPNSLGTAHVLAVGSGCEGVKQGLIHSNRDHFTRAITERFATALPQGLNRVALTRLGSPCLDLLLADLNSADSPINHDQYRNTKLRRMGWN